MTFFSELSKPVSVDELVSALKKFGLRVDLSTVYRELSFLVDEGFLQELDLGLGRKHYERSSDHHHHVVCRSCHAVGDVDLKDCDDLFTQMQKRLEKQSGFQNLQHQLAFMGLCSSCT